VIDSLDTKDILVGSLGDRDASRIVSVEFDDPLAVCGQYQAEDLVSKFDWEIYEECKSVQIFWDIGFDKVFDILQRVVIDGKLDQGRLQECC
jgi:hypothetical protein